MKTMHVEQRRDKAAPQIITWLWPASYWRHDGAPYLVLFYAFHQSARVWHHQRSCYAQTKILQSCRIIMFALAVTAFDGAYQTKCLHSCPQQLQQCSYSLSITCRKMPST